MLLWGHERYEKHWVCHIASAAFYSVYAKLTANHHLLVIERLAFKYSEPIFKPFTLQGTIRCESKVNLVCAPQYRARTFGPKMVEN